MENVFVFSQTEVRYPSRMRSLLVGLVLVLLGTCMLYDGAESKKLGVVPYRLMKVRQVPMVRVKLVRRPKYHLMKVMYLFLLSFSRILTRVRCGTVQADKSVRHANRGRLLLRTPGPVPLWDLHLF